MLYMHKTISIPTITVMAVATELHHDFLIIAKAVTPLFYAIRGSLGDICL